MFTMIKVLEESRELAKKKAKARGMTLYGYIKMLIDNDLKGK